MKILEELWYGNIRPVERKVNYTEDYRRLSQTVEHKREELLKLLSCSEKEVFQSLTNSQLELHCIDECEIFTLGFKLGARVMLESMGEIRMMTLYD